MLAYISIVLCCIVMKRFHNFTRKLFILLIKMFFIKIFKINAKLALVFLGSVT